MAVGAGITRWAHVEIGGQLIVHPEQHRLAKAADHDADGDHHGDGGRKRADQDRRAPQRCGQAARGEQRFHAENFAQELRESEVTARDECGNRQRRRRDQQDRSEIAEERPARNGRREATLRPRLRR